MVKKNISVFKNCPSSVLLLTLLMVSVNWMQYYIKVNNILVLPLYIINNSSSEQRRGANIEGRTGNAEENKQNWSVEEIKEGKIPMTVKYRKLLAHIPTLSLYT